MWKRLAIALMVLLLVFPCIGRAADAPKADAAKTDAAKPDVAKPDPAKTEHAKPAATKADAPKVDAPKADAAKPDTKAPVSYQKDVLPILTASCMGCHTPEKKKGGLDMTSYSLLAKGGKEGVIFVAGQPDKSKLVTMDSGPEPQMPEK